MIVCDAAPLIYLSKVGRLELLKRLYDQVLIPQGVLNEVVTQAAGRPGAIEVRKAVEDGWITVEAASVPSSLRAVGLEGADGELIELAKQKRVPLLTNDRTLAGIARIHGVSVRWLTQALVEAVDVGALRPAEARGLLRELVRAGLRVRSEVMAEIIHLIEERRGK